MADDRYEIRLSGSGGQGIILASIILAEAASIFEGYQVSQTQSYGPQARGGRCKAEVVISKKQIDYPKAMQLDMMLAMNQASCDAYCYDFKHNGLLIIDSSLVEQVPTSRVVALPFTQIANQLTGKNLVANIVGLGALGYLCPFNFAGEPGKSSRGQSSKGNQGHQPKSSACRHKSSQRD